MSIGRGIVSTVLAFSLAACGGGGGGGASTGGGTGGGGTTADCSLGTRQDWALGQINEWYLFPDLLDTTVNKVSFGSVQSYIDALVAPARAQNRDRFFTYLTSIQEENDLIANGSNAGFGVRLSYDTSARRVFVVEAFETAPAFAQGIDRGSEILAINGQTVSSIMAANPGNPAGAVSDALGPTQAGVTRSLTIRQPDGSQFTVDVTKADYSLDPISDRYGALILDNGGTNVGYINLRTFIIQDASNQLRQAFDQFRQQGIEQIILDLRYNGGGLVSVAELLGDLLGADKTGQVFSKTIFRSSKSVNDDTKLFESQTQAIAATKLAIIGTENTASASELVPNSFIPYLGTNIALIGTDTYGKPVGQIARDRSACDDRLRLVAFRTVNSDDGGDYYDGLASVMPRTCSANDDYLKPLGDPQEASIATALDFLAGRSCTAISSVAKSTAVRDEGPGRELMQATRPSAAQVNTPGLF
ncbi:S41 family peptidase [Erythrobacter mangrovi]|uniref:Peptidase S41 n=1 Tax=Erythrobacter mangrovi TaxID=2739433 RepID=A0A7D4B8T4_9SPHN|nr:S41 family peptidase [Erythrobacter mangrovi]QKG70501.1 peptidase S41 [Erythrobacter mangrovi]